MDWRAVATTLRIAPRFPSAATSTTLDRRHIQDATELLRLWRRGDGSAHRADARPGSRSQSTDLRRRTSPGGLSRPVGPRRPAARIYRGRDQGEEYSGWRGPGDGGLGRGVYLPLCDLDGGEAQECVQDGERSLRDSERRGDHCRGRTAHPHHAFEPWEGRLWGTSRKGMPGPVSRGSDDFEIRGAGVGPQGQRKRDLTVGS